MNFLQNFPLILCFSFLCFNASMMAQIRLDVDGDAKINGNLNISDDSTGNSIYIGKSAGAYSNSLAFGNTFLGNIAGFLNTSGSSNTFIGHISGVYNTTGDANIFVGSNKNNN